MLVFEWVLLVLGKLRRSEACTPQDQLERRCEGLNEETNCGSTRQDVELCSCKLTIRNLSVRLAQGMLVESARAAMLFKKGF